MLIAVKLVKIGVLSGFAAGAVAGIGAVAAMKMASDPACRDRVAQMLKRETVSPPSDEAG